MKETYTSADTINTLSVEQLDLMARTQSDLFIQVIKDSTVFDVHRIRLLLELGCIEAKRRLQAKENGNG